MQKRTKTTRLIITLCITACFISAIFSALNGVFIQNRTALADGINSYLQSITPIFPREDRYMTIDEPSTICYGDGTLVALDKDKFVAKGDINGIVGGLPTQLTKDSVWDIGVFKQFIFVLYGVTNESGEAVETYLDIFDIKNGVKLNYTKNPFDISTEATPSLPNTFSLDSKNGVLYSAYGDRAVRKYPLSVDINGGLTIGAHTKINTSPDNSFDIKSTFNGGKIYFLNARLSAGKVVQKIRVLDMNGESLVVNNDFATVTDLATEKTKLSFVKGHLLLTVKETILAIDTTNPTVNFTTSISGSGIASSGDSLFLSSVGGASTISEYSLEGQSFIKISDFGYKGNADTLLSRPAAITAYGNYYYALDAGNTRVVRYEMQDGVTIKNVKTLDLRGRMGELSSIATDSNGMLYCGDTNGKITIWSKDFAESGSFSLETGNTADKMTFDAENNLYVLSSVTRRVYLKKSGETSFAELYSSVSPILDIGISHLGNILYIATADKIATYDLLKDKEERKDFFVNLGSYGISQIVALDVDKKGNIALTANIVGGDTKIFYIERKQTGYQLTREIMIKSSYDGVKLSPPVDFMILASGDMLIVNSSKNLLGFISNKDASGNSILPFYLTIDSDYTDPSEREIFDIIKVKSDCYAYIKPNNYENVIKIKANDYFVTLADTVVHDGNTYYFIQVGNYKCYLPIASADKVENTPPPYSKGVVRHRTVKIYSKPILDDRYLVHTIDNKGAIIDIENTVNYYNESLNLGFVKVTYGEYSGYVVRDRISQYSTIEYSTTVKNYMKVKTNSVGAKIPLYKNAVATAEVLATIGDGDKVVLLETYDKEKEFLLVSYNGIEGYMERTALFKNGLSTSQIIAISLVSGVILIGIALFFIARAVRRRNYEYADGDNPMVGYYDDNDFET